MTWLTTTASSLRSLDTTLYVLESSECRYKLSLKSCDQLTIAKVFKREFGYLATFSFAVSISGLFACITTTFIYPITAGGASSAVWAWLISGMGCMCIAASVAELVSAYPTCGGL
jgi:membrane-bound metal-dependent hydrolase YbcI (DUF457 family)